MLTMQIICPVEERTSKPHRSSWTMRTMSIVRCKAYLRVWSLPKRNVWYVIHYLPGLADPQTALHDRSDLVESTIYPGLEDANEELTEVFEEMRGQLDKEMKRIAELRKVMEEDPGEFHVTSLQRSADR